MKGYKSSTTELIDMKGTLEKELVLDIPETLHLLLFPPLTLKEKTPPYESTHRRPLFPQKEGRVWRQKTYPAEEQEVNSPVTYLRRQAVESNLQQENGEIAVIGNQSQTREQILQDIDKATQLYLSCDDPTEAAARRLRVLAGDASGQVEETVTTMLAGSDPQADDSHKTHPLGTSSQVQSRDLIMEELQNVTLQYLSCADPAEAAARRLRVLAGECTRANGGSCSRHLSSKHTPSSSGDWYG
ncbi:hypothetical protein Bca52824_028486 [Brassica carinata]|uniref:Uncharacterized protein n=1 Tax=Brassica carinata TaxID=52824 RepID=A0A8X8AQ32_BRACI|nr:hypothetical protein Bca52824_028486 [Brassica carinata]